MMVPCKLKYVFLAKNCSFLTFFSVWPKPGLLLLLSCVLTKLSPDIRKSLRDKFYKKISDRSPVQKRHLGLVPVLQQAHSQRSLRLRQRRQSRPRSRRQGKICFHFVSIKLLDYERLQSPLSPVPKAVLGRLTIGDSSKSNGGRLLVAWSDSNLHPVP